MSFQNKTSLNVKTTTLDFYFFCKVNGNRENRIFRLKKYFERMPGQHLSAVGRAVFLVVPKLPGSRDYGGGFFRSSSVWRGKESVTLVPDEFFRSCTKTKFIGITQKAFNKNIYHFTILHESAHCVNTEYQIYQSGATISDFKGVRYKKPRVGEYAAEVYSRYLVRPHRICRKEIVPANETHRSCSRRLTSVLLSSPAWQNLPDHTAGNGSE